MAWVHLSARTQKMPLYVADATPIPKEPLLVSEGYDSTEMKIDKLNAFFLGWRVDRDCHFAE